MAVPRQMAQLLALCDGRLKVLLLSTCIVDRAVLLPWSKASSDTPEDLLPETEVAPSASKVFFESDIAV